jgi:hypothetical protein
LNEGGESSLRIIRILASLLAALMLSTAFAGTPEFRPSPQDSTQKESPKPDKTKSSKDKAASDNESTKPAEHQGQSHQPSANHPTSRSAVTPDSSPRAAVPALVWVNTDTRVFHKRGSKWYGKTKHGKYMSEADARRAGCRAAARE